MDKRINLTQAVDFVNSGDTLALGGVTLYRRPMSFIRALIRRYQETGEPRDLTLLTFTAGIESDLLVGAGMISRVRTCYFGLEIFGFAPMFTYFANRGSIEIIEETEASLASGLRAQMAGVGFLPARAWLGTDLPRLRPDVRTVTDPYNGEELIAFPAIQPDLAVIHALEGDLHGNAVIGGNKGIDQELALTARKVIVTAEKIVDKLNQADLVAPFTHHIAPAPGGALPSSCHPLYPLEGNTLLQYSEQVSDPDSFQVFLNMWLYPD
ncbi:MAG: CoA transferase subunit A [Anaerolineales bacterium]|nr:MAG: CoA transferase subunit A [Anaerolineales bacterium]